MTQQISDQAVAQKLLQSQIVSQGDLQKALAVQAQLKSQGHNFSLAKVLVQSRMTTLEAIKQAFSSSQRLPKATTTPPSPKSARFATQADLTVTVGPAPSSSKSQEFISPAQAPTIQDLSGSQFLHPDNKATIQLSNESREANRAQRFGRYEVLSKLGQGGMGLVYKARHEVLERVVALKTLSLHAQGDPAEALLRFEREAKTMAKLQHAHIVPIYDIGGEGHQAYIAMEYVSGGSIAEIIARDGKVDPHRTLIYALKMARALEHAHKAEIIHRDLKPANILISEDGEPMIADFGLALIKTSTDQRLSRSGTVVGTLHYMPPEQLDSKSAGVDHRSDIYSMGATLFEMLTGYAPHNARSSEQLMYEIIFGAEPNFPDHCQNVPEALKAIVLKCLQRKAEDRYQSATALSHDLSACMAGKKTTAKLSKKKVKKALKAKATGPKIESSSKSSNITAPKAILIGLAAAFGFLFFTIIPLSARFSDPKPDPETIAQDAESQTDSESPAKAGKETAAKDKTTDVKTEREKGDKGEEPPAKDPEQPPKPKEEPRKDEPVPEPRKDPKTPVKPEPPINRDVEKKEDPAPPAKVSGLLAFDPHQPGPKPGAWIFLTGRLNRELKEHLARRAETLRGKPDPEAERSTFKRLFNESGPIYFNDQYDWGRVFFRIQLCLHFYDFDLAARHLQILENGIKKNQLKPGQVTVYALFKVNWLISTLELQSGLLKTLKRFGFRGSNRKRQLIEQMNQESFRNLVQQGLVFLENNKIFGLVPGLKITQKYLLALKNKDESAFKSTIQENQRLIAEDPLRVYFQVFCSMLTRVPQFEHKTLPKIMSKAIELEKTPSALALRGHFYSSENKTQRMLALQDFNEAIARAPRLAQAYRYRFYLHIKTGDKAAALADLKAYLVLVPEDQLGPAMQMAFNNQSW